MPRPQFTLQALLVTILAVACFLGGIRFERERRRRQNEVPLVAPGIINVPLVVHEEDEALLAAPETDY